MYSPYARTVYAFHGCDQKTKDQILSGKSFFVPSQNDYDWLGTGIYFWENDYQRALQFAQESVYRRSQTKGHVVLPAVIGAVIDLGLCCNLLDRKYISLVKKANEMYCMSLKDDEKPLINKGGPDRRGRYRDCVVINTLMDWYKDKFGDCFDTVRSVFFEGNPLYDTSGFYELTHIQICVRNPNCIKAVFDPRTPDGNYRIP